MLQRVTILTLSAAAFALTTGIAFAQDEGDVVVGDEGVVWTDEGVPGDDGVIYVDDGGEVDEGGVIDDPVPVDSNCGGCEYWTMADGGDRPVMENARGDVVAARAADGWDAGNGPDLFARDNICLDADLYVGFLCDWQRPFLGGMMP